MPELPEVETIVRQLKPALIGETLVGLTPHWCRTLQISEIDLKGLYGTKILDISRRGKWILIMFSKNRQIILHLRMTGRLSLQPQKRHQKHLRASFSFRSGKALYFYDLRKFGRILFHNPNQGDLLGNMGVEALDAPALQATLHRLHSRRAVKSLLLDQSVIAGIGNIYADEALFHAGIHPNTPFMLLDAPARERLCESIRKVLMEAIENGGSSISDYRDLEGQAGQQQLRHQVYRRTGQPCIHCSASIRRTVIAGRSSHFCPHCQPPLTSRIQS